MKILLVCSSGMSTSLLVNKMKEASAASDKDDEIWAVGQNELDAEINKCDVVLLGPQMRIAKSKIDKQATELNIPCEIIPPTLYGRVDGQAVLDMAYDLVK